VSANLIEFGQLSDEAENESSPVCGTIAPSGATSLRLAPGSQELADEPVEQLEKIEQTLADLDDDFQPAGSIEPEVELVFDASQNPFGEAFAEETVVVDRYHSAGHSAKQRLPMRLEATVEPSQPARQQTTPQRPIPSATVEYDTRGENPRPPDENNYRRRRLRSRGTPASPTGGGGPQARIRAAVRQASPERLKWRTQKGSTMSRMLKALQQVGGAKDDRETVQPLTRDELAAFGLWHPGFEDLTSVEAETRSTNQSGPAPPTCEPAKAEMSLAEPAETAVSAPLSTAEVHGNSSTAHPERSAPAEGISEFAVMMGEPALGECVATSSELDRCWATPSDRVNASIATWQIPSLPGCRLDGRRLCSSPTSAI